MLPARPRTFNISASVSVCVDQSMPVDLCLMQWRELKSPSLLLDFLSNDAIKKQLKVEQEKSEGTDGILATYFCGYNVQ